MNQLNTFLLYPVGIMLHVHVHVWFDGSIYISTSCCGADALVVVALMLAAAPPARYRRAALPLRCRRLHEQS